MAKKKHLGDMVLGMHDALVSQTGIITGLTFALADNRLIILTGIVAAVSSSLSMAASNYLAEKSDGNANAIIAGLYTGGAYFGTAAILLSPFIMRSHTFIALIVMYIFAIGVIFLFNLFTAKKNFIKRFSEMLTICVAVSAIAFIIGQLTHYYLPHRG